MHTRARLAATPPVIGCIYKSAFSFNKDSFDALDPVQVTRSLTTLFQLPPGALERAVLNVEINTEEMIGICTRKLKFLVLKVQNTSRRPEKTFPFAFRFPTDIDGCIQSARASYTKVTVLSQDGLYEASCRRSF